MIASKSSCFASAEPISLISDSSALRSRVSSIARARVSADPMCCATNSRTSTSASYRWSRHVRLDRDDADRPALGERVARRATPGRACRSRLDLASAGSAPRQRAVDHETGSARCAGRMPSSRRHCRGQGVSRASDRGGRIDRVDVVREIDRPALVVVQGDIEVRARTSARRRSRGSWRRTRGGPLRRWPPLRSGRGRPGRAAPGRQVARGMARPGSRDRRQPRSR